MTPNNRSTRRPRLRRVRALTPAFDLMKEIAYQWKSSAALAWAFFWRIVVVYIPTELFTRWTSGAAGLSEFVAVLITVVATLGSFLVAAHWIRARGFSSVNVILVEWADYQRAQSESVHAVEQAVQGGGPALRRARALTQR